MNKMSDNWEQGGGVGGGGRGGGRAGWTHYTTQPLHSAILAEIRLVV